MLSKKIIYVFVVVLLASCTNENSELTVEKNSNSVVVVPMSVTGACASDADLYHIECGRIILDNVKLSDKEVKQLKAAVGFDTVSVDISGYSSWENWESGRGRPYSRAFSSSDRTAQQCGIAAGVYLVEDVYLTQTYTLPSNLVIILDNNAEYSTSTTTIGWNPDNLSTRGFKSSLSDSTVTMQTAAFLLEYTTDGKQTYRTYPVNIFNIVWKLKYLRLFY